MPFRIIRNDITKVTADAIVNTANPRPQIGRGTDGAIYEAAGREDLLRERQKIGRILPGEAAVTPAFALDAKYIIHTVGPEWHGGERGEFAVLASCYRKSLLLADQLRCRSIAFPLISAGVYGFPRDKALDTAMKTIAEFVNVSEMDITLVVFDKKAFDLSAELVRDVTQFIDENYVGEQSETEYGRNGYGSRSYNMAPARSAGAPATEYEKILPDFDVLPADTDDEYTLFPGEPFRAIEDAGILTGSSQFEASSAERARPVPKKAEKAPVFRREDSLEAVMKNLGQTFQERLLSLIDARGLTDTQVYKRANLDRKLFSKIRCNVDYKPSKATALALAVGLRLNLDETVDLLRRAGLALSPSSRSDLVVQYCITHGIYDIYEVNALLFNYDLQTLN